ncbi:MAG: DUF6783 domain-containing protein [Blautia faecis]
MRAKYTAKWGADCGMIFQTGSRHRMNSRTVTGLDVLCSVTQMN